MNIYNARIIWPVRFWAADRGVGALRGPHSHRKDGSISPTAPRGALWVSKCDNGVVYLTSVMVVVCLIIVLYFQPRRRLRESHLLGRYCRVKVH